MILAHSDKLPENRSKRSRYYIMIPKITHPLFDVTIPSTKKKTKVRPMLGREEKILLIAKQGRDKNEILSAVKNVVTNCIHDANLNLDTLTTFDIEYLFVKLRAVSINNVTKVTFLDNEDEKEYEFEIDLNNVEIKYPENVEKIIKISDTIGIELVYPAASLFEDTSFTSGDEIESFDKLICKCISKIFEGEKVYQSQFIEQGELIEFLDNLDIPNLNKIRAFVTNLPCLDHQIKYTNSVGTERQIVLKTLEDFFILY